MAPLSRSPARIASVRIPSGSLGDTGAATGTAPCGRAQPSRPAMHSHHGVVLITDCSGASSLAWQGRLAVRSGLMPASRAFCALRWPMSNSHPGLGLRGRRPSWRRWTGCWLRRGPVRAGCWSWAARRESARQRLLDYLQQASGFRVGEPGDPGRQSPTGVATVHLPAGASTRLVAVRRSRQPQSVTLMPTGAEGGCGWQQRLRSLAVRRRATCGPA